MLLGFLLRSVNALVFDAFTAINREHLASSYSKNEVSIANTKLKIEENTVSISGLSNQEYLLCFREGSLLFPSHPADQQAEHKIEVEEGDFFVWTKLNWQHASFQDDLYAGMTEDTIDLESVYHFKVAKSASLMQIARSKAMSWKTLPIRQMPIIMAFFLLFAVVIGITVFEVRHHSAQPSPIDPCNLHDAIAYRYLSFQHNSTSHPDQVFLVSTKRDFNMTEEEPCAIACLWNRYPYLDPSGWELVKADHQYQCASKDIKDDRLCSE